MFAVLHHCTRGSIQVVLHRQPWELLYAGDLVNKGTTYEGEDMEILSMLMCIQNLVKFCPFILKILIGNEIMTSIKGHNSVQICEKWHFTIAT